MPFTRHDPGRTDHEGFNLVSISLSDSLPSSLGTMLPTHSSISPKFQSPNDRRSFFGRRRSTSLSRWTFNLPRHLPLWARWSILSLIVFVALLHGILKGQTIQDRRAMFLASKTKLNWAFTRLKPQKVAIYCGRKADFGKFSQLEIIPLLRYGWPVIQTYCLEKRNCGK